jgi:hypothetical protein
LSISIGYLSSDNLFLFTAISMLLTLFVRLLLVS